MKKRVIAAVVLIPVLLLLALVAPQWVGALAMGLLLSIGTYELLYQTRLVRHSRLLLYSMAMAFAVTIWSYLDAIHAYLMLLLLVYCVLLFMEMMMDHVKVRIEMLGLCILGGFFVPYLLSALVRILTMGIGRYVVLIPFVVAFASDAGAYFIGLKFGKHKLAPVVSPNKTIEGAVSGVIFGALGGVLAFYVQKLWGFDISIWFYIIVCFIGGIIGQFGDLLSSTFKRWAGVKDFGNLIPGHGGAMDRLDSAMIAAPMVLAAFTLFIK